MGASGLRHEIEELVAAGHWQRAAGLMRVLWEQEGGAPLAGFVVSTFGKIAGNLDLAPHRCAILRSFTVEPIVPVLKACALISGVDLAVQLGEFNAYQQELLDEGSSLYDFQTDTVILAILTRDIAPELWLGPGSSEVVSRVTNQFEGWIRAFRGRNAANLIIHSLETPAQAAHGV